MTQEQYNRAVKISLHLGAFMEVKNELADTTERRLTYSRRKERDYECCPDWKMQAIRKILDRHDKMIREEIDAEIEKLKKEIEEL